MGLKPKIVEATKRLRRFYNLCYNSAARLRCLWWEVETNLCKIHIRNVKNTVYLEQTLSNANTSAPVQLQTMHVIMRAFYGFFTQSSWKRFDRCW